MAVELAEKQAGYRSEYLLKREYNKALRERVMAVLDPVLDAEAIQPEERQQLEEILLGNTGRIQLSENAVRTLFQAELLAGFISSTEQVDSPGWKHMKQTEHDQRQLRYTSYFVRLPVTPEGYSVASVGIKLEAETAQKGRRDFTRWVLARD